LDLVGLGLTSLDWVGLAGLDLRLLEANIGHRNAETSPANI